MENAGRPYLGITFDTQYTDAAVAHSVVPGGPADQAGIQAGDTIDAINDNSVASYRDAYAVVETLRPGEIVDIDFSRRVSGRTQAVLGRNTTDDASVENYAEEELERAYPERPASGAVEERLPQERSLRVRPAEEPLPEQDYYREFPRSNSTRFRDTASAPRMDYNGAGVARRNSQERQIIIERRRPAERGFRGRPLLPWRRN